MQWAYSAVAEATQAGQRGAVLQRRHESSLDLLAVLAEELLRNRAGPLAVALVALEDALAAHLLAAEAALCGKPRAPY